MMTQWMNDEIKKINAFSSHQDLREYMKTSWAIKTKDLNSLSDNDQLIFWKGFMHGYIYLAKEEAINYS